VNFSAWEDGSPPSTEPVNPTPCTLNFEPRTRNLHLNPYTLTQTYCALEYCNLWSGLQEEFCGGET